MKPQSTVRTIALCAAVLLSATSTSAQNIGTFASVTPTAQTQNLVLPVTHRFQRIIKTGDALPGSGGQTLGTHTDFTGYVPVSGSSRNGYLSISSETSPAAVAILGISYSNTNHLWTVNNGGNVSFPAADLVSTARFCSGTVTPNGTIMVSEESTNTNDVNGDNYHDLGWIIEINPATKTVINQDATGGVDKLWAIGKASRENAVIKSDNSILYTGADESGTGFLYKFVPTVPGNFSSGLLYGLRTTALLGNGTWKLIPNTTKTERNATTTYANSASGGGACFNFNGIEDVEIGPDGKVYFAAKNEGKIYRFTDNGTVGTAADVSGLEVFAGNDAYPTIKSYDIDGAGSLPLESWGRGNDNLAFDGDGNLWVRQDAIVAADRNHIWVIAPGHTQASPQVRVFATTPTRSEPTGITFTPDYKFMFVSFMSPSANTTPQVDAAGTSVIFNTHTTVVIGRVESLGSLATLPVSFTAFDAKAVSNAVAINWSVKDINNHDYFSVERSTNGVDFEEIHRNNENINGYTDRSFTIMDNNLPATDGIIYYRIKQCDINDVCHYSDVKKVKLSNGGRITRVYPQPANDKLTMLYYSQVEGVATIRITDIHGKVVLQQTQNLGKGSQSIHIITEQLVPGMYLVTVTDKNYQQTSQKIMKE